MANPIPEPDALLRREFLRLMGASLALGGVGACTRQPDERIYPNARSPEERVPGKPLFFATAMPMTGGAQPILVESHMGRPTKVEGNPEHPSGFAGTTALAQASVLGLYDPDRSRVVKQEGRIRSWPSFLGALREALDGLPADGTGLRILTETVLSPTLADQLWALVNDRPAAVWHQYEPVNRDAARAGATLAFGEDAVPLLHLDRADVVLAIDADFLTSGPACVRHAADFSTRRRAYQGGSGSPRLYAIESTPTPTGSVADHRLALSPAALTRMVQVLAREVGVGLEAPELASLPSEHRRWVEALAADLKTSPGHGLVVAGELLPPAVQALAHAMNLVLGSAGATVDYIDPIEMEPVDEVASLKELSQDAAAGDVQVLLILGGNPAYGAPADLGFGEVLERVPFSAHLSLHEDETSRACRWHVPQAHFLESWSDTSTYDATATIVQPLIAPLYEGRSPHELLAALGGRIGESDHDIVRRYWKQQSLSDDFDASWEQYLHDGWLPDTAFDPKEVHAASDLGEQVQAQLAGQPAEGLQVLFRPHPAVWDGRFANNGWLQELPDTITKLTWDNAALLAPATARRLGVDSEDLVEITCGERRLEVAALVVPGHGEDCATLHLGYGRTSAGEVGSGTGSNAYRLMVSDAPWSSPATLRGTGRWYRLARTQSHDTTEGRDIVRTETSAAFAAAAGQPVEEQAEPQASLNPVTAYPGRAWAMVIDLTTCTGCNACITACQAENNIPVVGKREVFRGRKMQWMRIDRYYDGERPSLAVHHQPVPCMHCESAPCETVCPAGATVHTREGLNDMVYNRCVGTRYCEANCPYKVRHFNFYRYADYDTPSLKMQRNPDVTVRSRGVMEKCTYCVQRINEARIQAEEEGREIRDGEVVTACQAACPSSAIVFGDLHSPGSHVSRLKELPHNYGLLAELGTRPRTTYLAEIRNPNPSLDAS